MDLEELETDEMVTAPRSPALATWERGWRWICRVLVRLHLALRAGGDRLLVWTRARARHRSLATWTARRAPRAQRRLIAWMRVLWPGWPTTWSRLTGMAAGAFLLGCGLVLPFALAARSAPPPVAVARAVPARPAPTPMARTVVQENQEVEPARADVARELARESFENGHTLDGMAYFRIARRAERRAGEDDLLILCTIAALADNKTAPAASSLLRWLGSEAMPLLRETAQSHPDQVVKVRARALIAPPRPKPFLRWMP